MPRTAASGREQLLAEIERAFELDGAALKQLTEHFVGAMRGGLAGRVSGEMDMIPSYVTGLPDGSEVGTFLALDLGGTNLRVCRVQLLGQGQVQVEQAKFRVSDELQTGSSMALFGFIADCIGSFLEKHNELKQRTEPLHMGFTFSFPVQQTGIASGNLLHWTKGFDCKDAVGRDVVQLLQKQLQRRGINVQVSALINDTVGALLASAYEFHGKTILGAIYGTGTNGAYIEKIANIPRFQTAEMKGHKTMIVNTEWGGYDSEREALPVTRFDNAVDRLDIRPHTHVFEKMISGMYLGEIARHVLLELVDELVLFEGYSSPRLNRQYGFDTALMSAIEEHSVPPTSPDSPTRRVLLEELHLDPRHVSAEDIKVVERVCAVVGRRAARLSAVAISATIIQTERTKGNDTVQIGVDGSVIQFYPGFDKSVLEAIADVLGKETADRVRIDHARDGSGVGAALGALQASKQVDGP